MRNLKNLLPHIVREELEKCGLERGSRMSRARDWP
jgi:hypothetical protein